MNKKTKFLSGLCVLALSSTQILAINSSAKFCSDRTSCWNGYSIIGAHVVSVTLHADGYNGEQGGRVTNHWITDWSVFPNCIEGKTSRIIDHDDGQAAFGEFTSKIGIPTPWGTVGFASSSHSLKVNFYRFDPGGFSGRGASADF